VGDGQHCVRINFRNPNPVIPAQAGNQFILAVWFPACAGMTKNAALKEFGNFWDAIAGV